MNKGKAAVATAAVSDSGFNNHNPDHSTNQSDFDCYEIAVAGNLEGGKKKRRGNFMFICPRCGKDLLGISLKKNGEHGGCWKCLCCNIGGNRFELAAFIHGDEYPKDRDAVHCWIEIIMEKQFGRIIEFKTEPRVPLKREQPKIVNRCAKILVQGDYSVVPHALADAVGELKAAILQDVHFLNLTYHRNGSSMSRSIAEWQARFSIRHPRIVRNALKELLAKGFLFKTESKGRTYWQVNYERLNSFLTDRLQENLVSIEQYRARA
jgi:hypothetical protein